MFGDTNLLKTFGEGDLSGGTKKTNKNMIIVAPAIMAAMMNQNAAARIMRERVQKEEASREKDGFTMNPSKQKTNIKPTSRYGWSKELGR